MKIRNFTYSMALLALFAFAGTAAAQGTETAPTLEMSANVESAMKLTISTDLLNGGVAVNSSSANEFTVNFGNVNGLGLGTPSAGVSVVANGTGAVYSTPINLTPNFSGFTGGEDATIFRMAGGSDDDDIAREGSSAVNGSVLPGSATSILTGLADDSLNTRYVAFVIGRTESEGAKVATVIYSIVVD